MTDACAPFDHAMLLLGRRWAGGVVRGMLGGATRFSEIRAALPGITDRVLSMRLKELTDAGLVERYADEPAQARTAYRLTEAGRALKPVLDEVERWALRWSS